MKTLRTLRPTVTLSGGKARFEISHLTSGDLLYFNDAKEGRGISMTADFGGRYVYVALLK